MKEFTFICISYCQENLITEHLESIKRVISQFGSGIENDLIVADDGSKDRTAEVAQEWIDCNRSLFRSAQVLPKAPNMGTVKNIYRAVDSCRTENFKILAGDDKYNCENIYALYDSMNNEMVITPVIPFGEFNGKEKALIQSFRRSYRLVMAYQHKNNLGELILYRNYLFAPGIFIPSAYWRDTEVREMLSHFQYIEDTPMWMKLLYDRKIPVRFDSTPYISYRVSAKQMLDSTRSSAVREKDDEAIRQLYPQRLLGKNKYAKPRYYRFIARKTFYTYSKRYDNFFNTNPMVKKVYTDMLAGEKNAGN